MAVQSLLSELDGSLVPASYKTTLSLDSHETASIQNHREAIRRILAHGTNHDDRIMVLVGPCSIHSMESALHYARLLAQAAAKHQDDLLIVMRVYIEKPRTTVGWKGLVHSPDLTETTNDAADLAKGLAISRHIMLEVTRLGLPVVTEVLTPLVVPFVDDLLACGVIGARTTESQTHRELASGLAMPVGFKNGTDGSLDVAINAMASAAAPHSIISVDDGGRMAYKQTAGNDSTFLVLRGGKAGPNYGAEHTCSASAIIAGAGRGQPGVVVDCSHGNSSKDYRNQPLVAADVARQITEGCPVVGVMIESNINEGRQDLCSTSTPENLKYGVSVTDGCVGWEETEAILGVLASAVQQRRRELVPRAPGVHSRHEFQAKNGEVQVHVQELTMLEALA